MPTAKLYEITWTRQIDNGKVEKFCLTGDKNSVECVKEAVEFFGGNREIRIEKVKS